MKIAYSRRALSQLASVYEYLSERSPHAAHNVRGSIRATIARLVHMAMLGKLTDEPGVHVLIEPEYLYRVFYHIDGEVVTVLRISHGSQM
jgi:plasmid stabilization system protein ParE